VSEVKAEGQRIRLVLTGGPASIPATLTQGKMFFAMVENWLLRLLQSAAGSPQVPKFGLANARLKFGSTGKLTVESAQVIRATDPKLQ